jgi:dTDP-4-amino-4,6-dideoxygalactose transaminase
MTDIHAAIGRVQLANLRDRTAMRKKNAEYFNRELDTVTTPFTHHDASHVYHQYTIRTNQRESLIELLIKEKIGHGVYYPIPVHQLPSFEKDLDLPSTRLAAEQVLSLPVHPFLTREEKETIVEVVNSWS